MPHFQGWRRDRNPGICRFQLIDPVAGSHELVEHFFRHESGRLVAVLAKSLGLARLDLVEDVVQAALLKALQVWSRKGIPEDPAAWLFRTARNLALDSLRRENTYTRILPEVFPGEGEKEPASEEVSFDGEIADAPLRLLFACCHEAVPTESRVALALKTLCGFGIGEIARALLTTEVNVQKRIGRAKEKLREENISVESLPIEKLPERLDAVMAVIYLLFNEGYHASHADVPIRKDLCEESIRLTRMLVSHPVGNQPQVEALLALLLFHSARFPSRVTPDGGVILLEDQNRETWEWSLIREGMQWMARSARGESISRYHLESAIAWEHCRAGTFAETDWARIVGIYRVLQKQSPSWVHRLNGAVAQSYVEGPLKGLEILAAVPENEIPEHYPLWHAVIGELHFRAKQYRQAESAWMRSLKETFAKSDQDLLRSRLAKCRRLLAGGAEGADLG